MRIFNEVRRGSLANRIARNAKITGTYFLDSSKVRGVVPDGVCLVEARMPFARFQMPAAYWVPIKDSELSNEQACQKAQKKAERGVLSRIAYDILWNENIRGPKGKLPA